MIIRSKRKVWEMLTALIRLEWRLPSGLRAVIRSYSDWCCYNEVFVNREYQRPIDALLDHLRPVATVWDIGANTGFFQLALADQFLQGLPTGRLNVVQFEGERDNFEVLKRRMAEVSIVSTGKVRVDPHHGLVGQRSGNGVLNLSKEGNMNFVSARKNLGMWRTMRGSESVPYIDLSQFLSAGDFIYLIKCDIEGSEFAFIENYPDVLRKCQRLVIEFHRGFGDIAGAEKRLTEAGLSGREVLREGGDTVTMHFWRVML